MPTFIVGAFIAGGVAGVGAVVAGTATFLAAFWPVFGSALVLGGTNLPRMQR